MSVLHNIIVQYWLLAILLFVIQPYLGWVKCMIDTIIYCIHIYKYIHACTCMEEASSSAQALKCLHFFCTFCH